MSCTNLCSRFYGAGRTNLPPFPPRRLVARTCQTLRKKGRALELAGENTDLAKGILDALGPSP